MDGDLGRGGGNFTPEELLVLLYVGRSEDVAEPSVLLIKGMVGEISQVLSVESPLKLASLDQAVLNIQVMSAEQSFVGSRYRLSEGGSSQSLMPGVHDTAMTSLLDLTTEFLDEWLPAQTTKTRARFPKYWSFASSFKGR